MAGARATGHRSFRVPGHENSGESAGIRVRRAIVQHVIPVWTSGHCLAGAAATYTPRAGFLWCVRGQRHALHCNAFATGSIRCCPLSTGHVATGDTLRQTRPDWDCRPGSRSTLVTLAHAQANWTNKAEGELRTPFKAGKSSVLKRRFGAGAGRVQAILATESPKKIASRGRTPRSNHLYGFAALDARVI